MQDDNADAIYDNNIIMVDTESSMAQSWLHNVSHDNTGRLMEIMGMTLLGMHYYGGRYKLM